MAEPPEPSDIPRAIHVRRRRWAMQWVWLLPVVAAVVGGWLAVRAILSDGPNVTIRFKTAEGIEPGRTRVKFKDVDIGVVRRISLADDRAGIIVRAELSKAAEGLVVEDTRFWVVRARVAGGSVSGITTLFSGSYIGMDPGKSTQSKRDFEGLETPPVITTGLVGKQFLLRSDDIGSLDVGSPVYFRRLEAGRVIGYELDQGGAGVLVRVFVNAPYDQYVTANTRFWHASGIDVALDANGLRFNTESLASVAIGGLAFQAPDGAPPQPASADGSTFTLFHDRVQAMKEPITRKERYVLTFSDSIRGLTVGAPVEFRGLVVGEVKNIDVQFDRERRELAMLVEIDFYPERLFRNRARTATLPPNGTPTLARMVERGLRAQLRTANLLTGQLYVALDFHPEKTRVTMDTTLKPPQIPTLPGSSQELQTTITSIARKLESLPIQEIGADLRRTLQSAATVLQRVDKEIAPEARDTLVETRKAIGDARVAVNDARKAITAVERAAASAERTITAAEPLPVEASDAMREIARAAEAFRVLADYLERHPEALIRGKRQDSR